MEDFIKKGQEFIDLLVKGDFAAAVETFDEGMKGAMPEPLLEKTWAQVIERLGKLVKQGEVKTHKHEDLIILLFGCEFEQAKLDLRLVYTSNHQVSGMFFENVTAVDAE